MMNFFKCLFLTELTSNNILYIYINSYNTNFYVKLLI